MFMYTRTLYNSLELLSQRLYRTQLATVTLYNSLELLSQRLYHTQLATVPGFPWKTNEIRTWDSTSIWQQADKWN